MHSNSIGAWVWIVLASFAGSLAALSFRPYQSMTRLEIAISLTVSATFAIFVGSWVATQIFGTDPVDIRLLGGLYWLMATGSNILIPLAVKKLGSLFGSNAGDTAADGAEQ